MKRAQVTAIALWCFAWLAGACGSPLVGLECKSGYEQCGDECFDLRSEALHCGACGVQCAATEMCSEGTCVVDPNMDAALPEASVDANMDATLDGALDGGTEGGAFGADADAGALDAEEDTGSVDGALDGDTGTLDGEAGLTDADADVVEGGWRDVQLPERCAGPSSADDCVCGFGELKCNKTCVDGNIDVDNCGQCGFQCTAAVEPDINYCVDGQCVVDCAATGRTACGLTCIDTTSDPRNCGGCGIPCVSGICRNSSCRDATLGHVIVIGHDLTESVEAMQKLASNAICLPARSIVRGVVYRAGTPPTVRDRFADLFANTPATVGRTFQQVRPLDILTPAEIPLILPRVDVLVIEPQTNASQATLLQIGRDWAAPLRTFVQRGGVVVLFEGGGTNQGTYQLLLNSGLFAATGFDPIPANSIVRVLESATADAVTLDVPREYRARPSSFTFQTVERAVYTDVDSDAPVVLHVSN